MMTGRRVSGVGSKLCRHGVVSEILAETHFANRKVVWFFRISAKLLCWRLTLCSPSQSE